MYRDDRLHPELLNWHQIWVIFELLKSSRTLLFYYSRFQMISKSNECFQNTKNFKNEYIIQNTKLRILTLIINIYLLGIVMENNRRREIKNPSEKGLRSISIFFH